MDALCKIMSGRFQDSSLRRLPLKRYRNKNFHYRGQGKAYRTDRQYRPQSICAVQNTAKHGTNQRGKGADGIDDGIGSHKMMRIHQRRNACLHGGLIRTCDPVQKHQCNRQKQDQVDAAKQQGKSQDHQRCKEVQNHHNIPLIYPVRNDTSDRREQDGRNKGAGRDRSVKR